MANTGTHGTETQTGGAASMDAEMELAIEACSQCHRVCLETMRVALTMGGKYAAAEFVELLNDCAQICQTSADFMIRGSGYHRIICGACAEICRACEQSCRRLGGEEMNACAEVCARCAESCTRMAAGRGANH
jgi:hypothetical protein